MLHLFFCPFLLIQSIISVIIHFFQNLKVLIQENLNIFLISYKLYMIYLHLNKVMPNERQSVDLYMKSGWNSEPTKIPSISTTIVLQQQHHKSCHYKSHYAKQVPSLKIYSQIRQ